MKERAIVFSGHSVRATFENRKSQTRRVVKYRGHWEVSDLSTTNGSNWPDCEDADGDWWPMRCPYGAVGDRLWVRERWAVGQCADTFKPRELHPGTWTQDNGGLWYEAASAVPAHPISPRGRWRSAYFMPRWAARLTLELTAVRVERLHDIITADCLAEGTQVLVHEGRPLLRLSGPLSPKGFVTPNAPTADELLRFEYATTWETLNAKRGHGWETDPWVWCLSFRRLGAGA